MEFMGKAVQGKILHSATFKTGVKLSGRGKKELNPSSFKSQSFRSNSYAKPSKNLVKKSAKEVEDERIVEKKLQLEEELENMLGVQKEQHVFQYALPDWRDNNRAIKAYRHIRHSSNYVPTSNLSKKRK